MNKTNIIALFCEDIREEKNELITLVGIYPDNVNVAPLQGMLVPEGSGRVIARLFVYLRFHFDFDADLPPYAVRIVAPGDHVTHLGNIDASVVSKAKGDAKSKGLAFAGVTLRAGLLNFGIMQPGLMKLEIQHGDEIQTVGGIQFSFLD